MLKFAFENLLSRSFRSLLALTGLAIAIGGMVALFSIAQGIDFVVNRTFAQIPGLSVQQRGAPVPLFSTLPATWGEEIEKLPGVTVVDAEIVQRLNVMDGKSLIAPPRFVVGLDLRVRTRLERDVYRENMKEGRFFLPADAGTNHCLISRQIADETHKTVGQTLQLNDYTAEIIGIYDTGSALLDVNILLDLNSVRQLMRIDRQTVSFFYVETAAGVNQRELRTRIEEMFLDRKVNIARESGSLGSWGVLATELIRKMQLGKQQSESPSFSTSGKQPAGNEDSHPSLAAPAPVSSVEVRLAEDWSQRFSEFTGDLKLFLMLITTMAVLIAVLSIVNTMTMSVSERMIEFGILRANGWSKSNIMQLMTWESGLLGTAGGIFGALIGWVTTLIVNAIYPDRLQLHASPALLIFAAVISIVLGILGGIYPSWLAASRSPMDAIRRG